MPLRFSGACYTKCNIGLVKNQQKFHREARILATIGMDKLFFATITEDEKGEETYGTPKQLAKAISADLTIDLAEANLFADDGLAYVVKDFKSGTLVIGTDDLPTPVVQELTGAEVDDNGVLISSSENEGKPVAIGFRAAKPGGTYRYFWLYRVKFAFPSTNLKTKGDTISFQTPSITGTIMRRNKLDGQGKHPWKAEVTEGETGVVQTVIDAWYDEVYEPVYAAAAPNDASGEQQ
jgi:phi13 family phage major tail protein